MSYTSVNPGAYPAGYAPAVVGPVAPVGGMPPSSATIEAPPTTETGRREFAMHEHFIPSDEPDEFHPKTLYVGNLDVTISEEFLLQLFSAIGPVTKSKIIHEVANDPYAFIEFQEHVHAVQALTAMNKRNLLGKEMKVNWATSPGAQQRVDTSKHYHVFVGDLSPEIDNRMLREAFSTYGQISDVKVIRDLQTLKSKGYGFVSFVAREEAERAIEQMNGQWLGRRAIRTNWATRKPGMPGPSYGERDRQRNQSLDEVLAQAGPNNCTVYVGGIGGNTSEDDLRQIFMKFGLVNEVRIFRQQGYAFVKYDRKESAGNAIYSVSGTEINGSQVRCSWGREGGYASASSQYPNYGYGYGGYGYGNGSGGNQGGPPGGHPPPQQPPQPNNQQQNYWNYYQQYYNNPAAYQQWQAYWQQGGGQGGGHP